MAFIPAPQVAQVVVKHLLEGEALNNVFAFALATPPLEANLNALAAAMQEAWSGSIMPQLSVDMTLVEVTARDLTTQDGVQVSSAPAATVVGGIGGDCLPASVAYCMTHRTALIGRSRRGRTYFGGIPESVCGGNNVTTTFSDDLQSAWFDVVTDVGVSGWQFGVLSRYTNKLPRTVAVWTPVTSSIFRDLRVDSQRGRLPG
jgi:hypothetical protein